jgi:biotin synthase
MSASANQESQDLSLANTSVDRWSFDEAKKIYNLPFNDLLFEAQTVHRERFDPNAVQLSKLLSIKTGG